MFMSCMQLLLLDSQVAMLLKRVKAEPAERVISRSTGHIRLISTWLLAAAPCLVLENVSETVCSD